MSHDFTLLPGQCRSDEYSCANGRCIDQSLQCNGYNACGDRSGCNNLHPGYILTIVAAGVVFILTIIVIVLGILLCRKQKSTVRQYSDNFLQL